MDHKIVLPSGSVGTMGTNEVLLPMDILEMPVLFVHCLKELPTFGTREPIGSGFEECVPIEWVHWGHVKLEDGLCGCGVVITFGTVEAFWGWGGNTVLMSDELVEVVHWGVSLAMKWVAVSGQVRMLILTSPFALLLFLPSRVNPFPWLRRILQINRYNLAMEDNRCSRLLLRSFVRSSILYHFQEKSAISQVQISRHSASHLAFSPSLTFSLFPPVVMKPWSGPIPLARPPDCPSSIPLLLLLLHPPHCSTRWLYFATLPPFSQTTRSTGTTM